MNFSSKQLQDLGSTKPRPNVPADFAEKLTTALAHAKAQPTIEARWYEAWGLALHSFTSSRPWTSVSPQYQISAVVEDSSRDAEKAVSRRIPDFVVLLSQMVAGKARERRIAVVVEIKPPPVPATGVPPDVAARNVMEQTLEQVTFQVKHVFLASNQKQQHVLAFICVGEYFRTWIFAKEKTSPLAHPKADPDFITDAQARATVHTQPQPMHQKARNLQDATGNVSSAFYDVWKKVWELHKDIWTNTQ